MKEHMQTQSLLKDILWDGYERNFENLLNIMFVINLNT